MVIVRFSRVWWAVLGMGHPLVRWSLQMMTQDGGMTAQLQGDHEGCRGSTTKLGGMWKISAIIEKISGMFYSHAGMKGGDYGSSGSTSIAAQTPPPAARAQSNGACRADRYSVS